jgi:diguanylate cyclase
VQDLVFVSLWVLGSVSVGLLVGFYVGRTTWADRQRHQVQKERDLMLKALVTLLESADQLNADVDTHTHEMHEMGQHVTELKLKDELEDVQQTLLGHISSVMESNKRLENDLTVTRFRMEAQAQEIDRTRAEARIDSLSGVANRKAFDETLQYLFAAWKRQNDPFVLILADVDHFKWINDTHGHPAGDLVVHGVGSYLKGIVRAGGYAFRFGGDEFAVLLPKADLHTGQLAAEKVLQGISRTNFDVGVRGERVSITFSMGVAVIHDGDSAESVLKRADDALYRAKQSGRNQVQLEGADKKAEQETKSDPAEAADEPEPHESHCEV